MNHVVSAKIFPQYRKLSNDKSFYKIISDNTFEEIQLVGTSTITTTIKATKYPEIIRIQDMLACKPPFESSTEVEFHSHIKT